MSLAAAIAAPQVAEQVPLIDGARQAQEQSRLGAIGEAVGHVAFAIFSAIPILGMAGYFVASHKAEKAVEIEQSNLKSVDAKALIKQAKWNGLAMLAARLQTGTGLALIPIILFKLGFLSLPVAWPIGVGLIALAAIVSIILFIRQRNSEEILIKQIYPNFSNEFKFCDTVNQIQSTYKKQINKIKEIPSNVISESDKGKLIGCLYNYKSEKIMKILFSFFVKKRLSKCNNDDVDVDIVTNTFLSINFKILDENHKNRLRDMVCQAAKAKKIQLTHQDDYLRPHTPKELRETKHLGGMQNSHTYLTALKNDRKREALEQLGW